MFTLPAELRFIALRKPVVVYDLLFAAAAHTLLDLGQDPQRLGGQLGITAVLHTWTRELTFHPHIHCIVTGGGLVSGQDRWIPTRSRYLFPSQVMTELFRGKLLDALRQAYDAGGLDLESTHLADPQEFAQLLDQLYRTRWVVHAKRPFAGPEQVFRYLGRYTHRVGISNERVQAFDGQVVRFSTKDGKAVTLSAEEFIRRFLLHILPHGFTKIRHFGLHSSANAKTKLSLARRLLEGESEDAALAPVAMTVNTATGDYRGLLLQLTGVDLALCPRCGTPLVRHPLPASPLKRDTS